MSAISEYLERLEAWDNKTFLNLYNSDFSKRTKAFAKYYSFLGSLYFWVTIWFVWWLYGYITKDYYLLVIFTSGFEQSILIHMLIRYKIIRQPAIIISNIIKMDKIAQLSKYQLNIIPKNSRKVT